MEYSIDYLSFTIPFDTLKSTNAHLLGGLVQDTVTEFMGVNIDALLDDQPFDILRGRAPYAASWGREDGGVRIFGAPQISHVLVEITGTGCKTLRAHNALDSILNLVAARVSRIDLAIDIECSVTPSEFAAKRDVKRFKDISDRRSETGDTFYVGSWTSDRFARVYRFAPPHPRADKLRVEHVFRSKAAKVFTSALLASSYERAANACGIVYGWGHPAWDIGNVEPMALVSGQVRKTNKNTVNWLYGAVTSSIVKSVKKGDIDLEDYIRHIRELVDSATKWG